MKKTFKLLLGVALLMGATSVVQADYGSNYSSHATDDLDGKGLETKGSRSGGVDTYRNSSGAGTRAIGVTIPKVETVWHNEIVRESRTREVPVPKVCI